MRILITGTAGFIGFHLANLLTSLQHEVVGIDNVNDYYEVSLKYNRLRNAGIEAESAGYGEMLNTSKNNHYRFAKFALEDKPGILRIFESFKPEVVVNLAAQAGVRFSISNPETYISSNVEGFFNILEACRKYPVKHLIYASSSSVYGLNKSMPFSEKDKVDHPVSLYAATKKSNELMAHTYSHLYGIPVTGLRFFTVYGPWGRPDMALFIFTKAILKGEKIPVFNFGNMERDFTYIDDITKGIERIINKAPDKISVSDHAAAHPLSSSTPCKLYNIGNSKPVKLLDFIHAIEKTIGKKAVLELLPIQPGDVEKTWADVSELIRDYNYCPDTPIEDGVRVFIKWYREYYNV